MQTLYKINHAPAVEGMPVGERQSVPRLLPYTAQVTALLFASHDSENGTLTVTDVASGQSYSVEFATGAALTNTIANCRAAVGGNTPLRNLFTTADDSTATVTFTAKHAARDYTFSFAADTTTGTPTTTAATKPTVGLGKMLAKGSTSDTCAVLGASTAASSCLGIAFRTDGNHFHSLENDTPSAEDLLAGGKTLALMQEGRCWVKVEDSVTQDSPVYVRRSGTGDKGAFRGAPAGSAQVSTVTPSAVDLPSYGFEMGYKGRHYTVIYSGDGSTTAAQASAGLVHAAGSIDGLTIATVSSTHLSITTDAGTALDYLKATSSRNDTPAASVAVSVGTATVDAIDVSDFCEFETSASAGQLALVRIKR
jgi:hypothetical protein